MINADELLFSLAISCWLLIVSDKKSAVCPSRSHINPKRR